MRKTLTKPEFRLPQGYISENQLRNVLTKKAKKDFNKWFYGQTGIIYKNEFYFPESDVLRWIKGLPVID